LGLFKHIKDVAGTTQDEPELRRDDAEWLEALKALAAKAAPPMPDPQPSPAWPRPGQSAADPPLSERLPGPSAAH